jgi:hypothetical protein
VTGIVRSLAVSSVPSYVHRITYSTHRLRIPLNPATDSEEARNVADLRWNQWPRSVGMGGWLGTEYAFDTLMPVGLAYAHP